MRICFLTILLPFLVACGSGSPVLTKKDYRTESYKLAVESDTMTVNKLRFYKHGNSSMLTMKLMYDNYGMWNKKKHGWLIWEDLKLFDDRDITYTVIALGDEIWRDYDTSLFAVDSNGKDCFKNGYPDKKRIIDLFVGKVTRAYLRRDSRFYHKLFGIGYYKANQTYHDSP